MVISPEQRELQVTGCELCIDDFIAKLAESLKRDREKLRESAEREVSTIINKAHEEAAEKSNQMLEKAGKQAEMTIQKAEETRHKITGDLAEMIKNSEKIMVQLFQETRQKTTSDAQQEANQIIINAKQAAAEIVNSASIKAQESNRLMHEFQKQIQQLLGIAGIGDVK